LTAHYTNNVWDRRDVPPDDWNQPLPDHLSDAAEDSYLRRYKEGDAARSNSEMGLSYSARIISACSIM
jgi:hypothetical protein